MKCKNEVFLPRITLLKGFTDFFGNSIEVTVEVNPDNLFPEDEKKSGNCTSCNNPSSWVEKVSKRGRRYYCNSCVDYLLLQTPTGE